MLPEVARETGVVLIVERPLYARDNVEEVDVTAALQKRLPPRP